MGPSPTIGLALGGGGARGLAHIHVLEAMDDLGLRPARIAGSSIGALVGAAYAAGLSGDEIAAYAVEAVGHRRLVASRLWRTRAASLAEFVADGGFRLGQLNAERLLAAFLPPALPLTFDRLSVPLTVMATDFYSGCECALEEGDLRGALAASIALPAIFRPVRRDGLVLLDGGIFNPLPFDRLCGTVDLVVAVDVTGGPVASLAPLPTPIEAIMGASQLMMQAVIAAKLRNGAPDLLLRPSVSRYKVMDFLRVRTILAETAGLREETKRRLGDLLDKPSPAPEGGIAVPA